MLQLANRSTTYRRLPHFKVTWYQSLNFDAAPLSQSFINFYLRASETTSSKHETIEPHPTSAWNYDKDFSQRNPSRLLKNMRTLYPSSFQRITRLHGKSKVSSLLSVVLTDLIMFPPRNKHQTHSSRELREVARIQ